MVSGETPKASCDSGPLNFFPVTRGEEVRRQRPHRTGTSSSGPFTHGNPCDDYKGGSGGPHGDRGTPRLKPTLGDYGGRRRGWGQDRRRRGKGTPWTRRREGLNPNLELLCRPTDPCAHGMEGSGVEGGDILFLGLRYTVQHSPNLFLYVKFTNRISDPGFYTSQLQSILLWFLWGRHVLSVLILPRPYGRCPSSLHRTPVAQLKDLLHQDLPVYPKLTPCSHLSRSWSPVGP